MEETSPEASASPVSDRIVIRKAMSDCVNEFIDDLPPDYRAVIVLSDLEGFASQEIAQILGISLDNVKIRLHRGRSRLKKALQEGCEFYYTRENTFACDRKQIHILPKKTDLVKRGPHAAINGTIDELTGAQRDCSPASVRASSGCGCR